MSQLAKSNIFQIRGALGRLLAAKATDSRKAEVTAALLPITSHANAFAQRESIRALGFWGTPDAVEPLLEVLATRGTFERQEAIQSLGQLGDARTAAPLASRLGDFFDHTHAMRALQALGPKAAGAVVEKLDDKDTKVRIRALQVLQEIGSESERQAIEQCATASNATEREAAKQALEQIDRRASGASSQDDVS